MLFPLKLLSVLWLDNHPEGQAHPVSFSSKYSNPREEDFQHTPSYHTAFERWVLNPLYIVDAINQFRVILKDVVKKSFFKNMEPLAQIGAMPQMMHLMARWFKLAPPTVVKCLIWNIFYWCKSAGHRQWMRSQMSSLSSMVTAVVQPRVSKNKL